MKLIIVRHGETVENVRGIIQGHRHGNLSENGLLQARALGNRLKGRKIDVIFSSDLQRAVNTTIEIAKHHDVPVHYVKSLREISMGYYEGKRWETANKARLKFGDPVRFKSRSGENYIDLRRRLRRFISSLYKKYRNKTVLLSTHGVAIRIMFSMFTGIPLEDTLELHPRNGGLLVVDMKSTAFRILEDDLVKVGRHRK